MLSEGTRAYDDLECLYAHPLSPAGVLIVRAIVKRAEDAEARVAELAHERDALLDTRQRELKYVITQCVEIPTLQFWEATGAIRCLQQWAISRRSAAIDAAREQKP